MIKKMKLIVFAASIVLCLSALVFGQERFGAIEGTVKDSTGAVVPNATVRIQGDAFDRTVVSDSEGFFRVQQVPPGTNYTVTIAAGNFKPFVQNNVIVQLGQSTPIDSSMSTTVEAVVEVTTDDGIATIDATTSKIQTNLDARTLETLPKGNNFTTALKAAAPVREEMTAGGFQIDGASGSENSFVVDGQDVTNFRSGSLNMNNNIPFQLIQELQIKSNGYEAEFGGATGGVINVVTKRGSDAFHGDIGDMDTTSFASLAAGNVAATSSMAKLIGEDVFPNVVHEGEHESIYIGVIGRSLLVVVFDQRSTLSLVKIRSKRGSFEVAAILDEAVAESAAFHASEHSFFGEITDDDIDSLFS